MSIFVINAGSSSLKYQLINVHKEQVLATGVVDRIGLDNSVIVHTSTGKNKIERKIRIEDHKGAVSHVFNIITDTEHGIIPDLTSIDAVGHRIVHGGERFIRSVRINDDVIAAIQENIELAPLHNPANLMGIYACKALLPGVPMVAVFDTAFHANMPKKAFLYGLPYNLYCEHRVRRYGFHGTSHKYVSERAARILGQNIKDIRMITCHLGNGSSVTAVQGGVSVDTSMGFTPLEGLIMGTRSGDIDAAIVPYLMDKLKMDAGQTIQYLNKKSGVLGISGISNDFRDLLKAGNTGNEKAKFALEIFSYRLKKLIGAYAAAMNGVDAIVFTGGIGENDAYTRELTLKGLEFLGIKLDKKKNQDSAGKEVVISMPESKIRVLIVPTNEELMIAMDTHKLIFKNAMN